MKVSWRPLTIFGFFVSKFYQKVNLSSFLFRWLDIDNTLVLNPKKTCGIGF